MASQVKWTQNAKEDYARVVSYLVEEWSVVSAEKFINIIKSRVEQLVDFPFIGVASQKDRIFDQLLLNTINYIIVFRRDKLRS